MAFVRGTGSRISLWNTTCVTWKPAEERKGVLWQMVATDGPHYGLNLKLKPGRYTLVYTIYPPSTGGLARHTDKETGVPEWWDPFPIAHTFDYPGPQK